MDGTIGQWQRISQLGEGSFGVVTLFRHLTSEKLIAVKCCKGVNLTPKQIERWRSEVEMMRTIRHPNIVSYEPLPAELEQGIENPSKLPLLPMEYCDKHNLRVMLRQPRNSSGLQEEDIRAVLGDMADALMYLHRLGIVHRDFKPENIVLKESGERKSGVVYKLIDLGFAKELDGTRSIVGTMNYAAPEVIQGKNYSFTIDYWSFGIVAFEIICGNLKYPFLPNESVPLRIKHLRDKKPNHICIYKTSRGIQNSSRINHRCHMSSCLKEMLEEWLQGALEYDGGKRCGPNGKNLLEELKARLNKRIVTVFSVFALRFQYYEINECVLLSTLRGWISRDEKIDPEELVLLTAKMCLRGKDDELLMNLLDDDDLTVFVFKRGYLWEHSAKLPTPDFLVADMKNIDRFTMLSSTMYCILNEKKHFAALARSLPLGDKYIKLLLRETYAQYEAVQFLFQKAVFLIESFKTVRISLPIKDTYFDLREKETYKRIITDSQCLITIINKVSDKLMKLKQRVERLRSFEGAINKGFQEAHLAVSKHAEELERNVAEAAGKIASVHKSKAGRNAFDIVSNTIKKRQEILRDLRSNTKTAIFVLEEQAKVKDWIMGIGDNIDKLVPQIHSVELRRYEFLLNANRDLQTSTPVVLNGNVDSRLLIKQNKAIRLELEDAINGALNKFRVQCETINRFLSNI